MRALILKTGSTVAPLRERRGDFEDWFRDGLGLAADEAPVVEVHLGEPLPDPARVPAVVVTGSPAMVTDEEHWSVEAEAWLRTVVGARVPVLGVCYGHQMLARALGGAAGNNPRGREIGTVAVTLTEAGAADPLFEGLPATLTVQSTHEQVVTVLPPEARLLAHNPMDGHQSFAFGDRCWATQFHPEFDADIIRGYLAARKEPLLEEGIDADQRAAEARDSEHGTAILRRFLALAEDR